MANIYEEISKSNSQGGGKPDANLANDANNLGGVPAEQYATHKYVQNYHNTKETAQKEYIDQQDAKTLQEAKEYTNSQIRNQNFSDFAKLKDVQAVDSKLSQKIEECGQQCANNLTTQIKGVVNDVNANFQDVNNAINQLNSSQNNLFQSVSSGKQKIAGAITDKGVATSANDSYDTMAGNIRSIKTGGGELAPGFVNTSDGTATASDILLGKTAYAKGEKIYGTLIAQPADGYPTIGTDTSNATATASDIALGKTAYARGQLITGTAITGSSDNGTIHAVEEIYGLTRSDYVFSDSYSMVGTVAPDESSKIARVFTHGVSKDSNYIVLACTDSTEQNPSTSDFFIESFPMNDNGIYYMSSKSATTNETVFKKHRYTKEELGIAESETIHEIVLGAPGFNGKSNLCLLYIRTSGSDFGIHIYTYHLEENGVIGKAYASERNVIQHLKIPIFSNANPTKLYTHPTRWDTFYFIGYDNSSTTTRFIRGKVETTISSDEIIYNVLEKENFYFSVKYEDRYKFSNDGKYILSYSNSNSSYNGIGVILLKEDGEYLSSAYTCADLRTAATYAQEMINNSNKGILANEKKIRVFEANFLSEAGKLSTEIIKEFNIKLGTSDYDVISNQIRITPDNSTLVALVENKNKYSIKDIRVAIFDISNILELENNADIEPIQVYTISSKSYSFNHGINLTLNTDGTCLRLFCTGEDTRPDNTRNFPIKTGIATSEQGNLIGLKYKNKYFYNMRPEALTAGSEDVVKGKTFVGNTGYPQTGTLETQEVNNE